MSPHPTYAGVRLQRADENNQFNLGIFWLRDKSLEETDDLLKPDIVAQEIADNLQTALEQFLRNRGGFEELSLRRSNVERESEAEFQVLNKQHFRGILYDGDKLGLR